MNKNLCSLEGYECELPDYFRSTMKVSTIKPKPEPVLHLYEDLRELEAIHIDDDTFEQKKIYSECVLGNLLTISFTGLAEEARGFVGETGGAQLSVRLLRLARRGLRSRRGP
ncbi:hypothetical protein V1517DRAFT_79785 [Lipomyces orientalis]|uniref:Uncharacterized protein n=1 Tax=Lipomyces orientalis TaxID=1233043 RepID=A0ACC3TDG1_9ASCO